MVCGAPYPMTPDPRHSRHAGRKEWRGPGLLQVDLRVWLVPQFPWLGEKKKGRPGNEVSNPTSSAPGSPQCRNCQRQKPRCKRRDWEQGGKLRTW